jgi:hypothetical protein
MKFPLLVLFLLLVFSCTKSINQDEISDEYALVEFAASLEENYQKIYPDAEQKDSAPENKNP